MFWGYMIVWFIKNLMGSPRLIWRILRWGLVASFGATTVVEFGAPEPVAYVVMILLFVALMKWAW